MTLYLNYVYRAFNCPIPIALLTLIQLQYNKQGHKSVPVSISYSNKIAMA